MSSKQELIEAFQRVLWAEKQMRSSYAAYGTLADEKIRKILKEIESDEVRHANMASQVISILKSGRTDGI